MAVHPLGILPFTCIYSDCLPFCSSRSDVFDFFQMFFHFIFVFLLGYVGADGFPLSYGGAVGFEFSLVVFIKYS